MLLHRMVAKDINGWDIEDRVVHHENESKTDNRPENLRLFEDQADHARHHQLKAIEEGQPPLWSYPKKPRPRPKRAAGDRPPKRGAADKRRALEVGRRLRDRGYDFRTSPDFEDGHRATFGACPAPEVWSAIERHYGGLQGYLKALDSENHMVGSVGRPVVKERFAVLLSRAQEGGPVVLWPNGNATCFGSGVTMYSL